MLMKQRSYGGYHKGWPERREVLEFLTAVGPGLPNTVLDVLARGYFQAGTGEVAAEEKKAILAVLRGEGPSLPGDIVASLAERYDTRVFMDADERESLLQVLSVTAGSSVSRAVLDALSERYDLLNANTTRNSQERESIRKALRTLGPLVRSEQNSIVANLETHLGFCPESEKDSIRQTIERITATRLKGSVTSINKRTRSFVLDGTNVSLTANVRREGGTIEAGNEVEVVFSANGRVFRVRNLDGGL